MAVGEASLVSLLNVTTRRKRYQLIWHEMAAIRSQFRTANDTKAFKTMRAWSAGLVSRKPGISRLLCRSSAVKGELALMVPCWLPVCLQQCGVSVLLRCLLVHLWRACGLLCPASGSQLGTQSFNASPRHLQQLSSSAAPTAIAKLVRSSHVAKFVQSIQTWFHLAFSFISSWTSGLFSLWPAHRPCLSFHLLYTRPVEAVVHDSTTSSRSYPPPPSRKGIRYLIGRPKYPNVLDPRAEYLHSLIPIIEPQSTVLHGTRSRFL